MNPTLYRIIKRTGPGLLVLGIYNGIKRVLPWDYIATLKNEGRIPNTALVKGRIFTVLPEEEKK